MVEATCLKYTLEESSPLNEPLIAPAFFEPLMLAAVKLLIKVALAPNEPLILVLVDDVKDVELAHTRLCTEVQL